MRITSSSAVEDRQIVFKIGEIKASSRRHAANRTPSQANWREAVLNEPVQKADDVDVDAITALDYVTSDVNQAKHTLGPPPFCDPRLRRFEDDASGLFHWYPRLDAGRAPASS